MTAYTITPMTTTQNTPTSTHVSPAPALVGEDPGHDLGAVVESAIAQNVPEGAGSAVLLIPRAEDDAVHARQPRGARAHRARLERHRERAAVEPPVRTPLRCLANRHDLGMRGRVVRRLSRVAPDADHGALAIEDDGADRHLAPSSRAASLVQGTAYRLDVLGAMLHGSIIAHAPTI